MKKSNNKNWTKRNWIIFNKIPNQGNFDIYKLCTYFKYGIGILSITFVLNK